MTARNAAPPDTAALLREAASLRSEGERAWAQLVAAGVPHEGQAGPVNGIAIVNMAESQIARRWGQRVPKNYPRDVQVLRYAAEQGGADRDWLSRVMALWVDVAAEDQP